MGREKTWLWDFFFEPGHKYHNDKTHKAAKCNSCVNGNLADVIREAKDELDSFQIEVMPSKQELLASGAWTVLTDYRVGVLIDFQRETEPATSAGRSL
jgi:hypothetical protein